MGGLIKLWEPCINHLRSLSNYTSNPDWVEWLMGYPISWTDGGSRRERLMALGNSVVPLIPEFLGKAVVNHYTQ